MYKLYPEFNEVDMETPFSNRSKSVLELFKRYIEIQAEFILKEKMGKKTKDDLLYEVAMIKRSINSQLPDYNKRKD